MAYSKTRYCPRCQDTATNKRNLPLPRGAYVCVCVSTDVCLRVCVSADVCLQKQQITNKQAKYTAYETVLANSRSNQKVNRDTEHGACLSFIL